ncbi:TonB-dependent receptor [Pontibacter sp. SGAir0037]|uniref:TonB-dependent receptor n=1 Tax=Pontibacter sp. SGAir0037 TaxID=2571030 RepID=UPI0010CCC32B|nr:TonB-dependent receptor [Pontibacter sp. SGAir0037]QCR21866.1 colicin receptor [Pontibacter sp. SGAir0037]
MLKYLSVWLVLLFPLGVAAQQVIVSGIVLNHQREPLEQASVSIKGTTAGVQTSADGKFRIQLPSQPDREVTLIIRYLGYHELQKTVQLGAAAVDMELVLSPDQRQLNAVDIHGNRTDAREQAGLTRLDPRITKEMPSAFGDFNQILVTLPGVSSNNELSSTYSVRGGNYDENLVYVNGIEIYRPFLITNAQQEGLSFVNPDLVGSINFSSGGWQPKYGDRLSSVLDIRYKTPGKLAGSVSGGLTGGSLHLEAASKNKRISYLLGTRYKTGQYLLQGLQVEGQYRPNFSDAQAYINIDLSRSQTEPARTTLGILASYARNSYLVVPESRVTTFGTRQNAMRLFVGYDGRELMQYSTSQLGINLSHRFNRALLSEIILSGIYSREREFRDIEAAYRLCDVNGTGGGNYGECMQSRGVGSQYDHARNTLLARVLTAEIRNSWQKSRRSQVQFGVKAGVEDIQDRSSEYGFVDSADFVNPAYYLNSTLDLRSLRYNGYLQHTYKFDSLRTITYGVRASYWTYSKEFTFTPRIQYAAISRRNPDLSYKAALGLYYQPPFYRELRNMQGQLNPEIRAQRSLHAIVGADYSFKAWDRDFMLTTEAYYKHMTNVIPYDVDNVRLRYYAQNNAKAYATGLDVRVNGEFIKGAESWLSLGILSTKEDVEGDSTFTYDAQGQISGKAPLGYINRPTNQLLNIGVFFQDHLPDNPTVRMNLNLAYGTGLPFGPPFRPEYRNAFSGKSYKRVDVGFSKLIVLGDAAITNTDKFSLESLWIGLEVLNLIAANNRLSYSYVTDLNNVTYAVPNFLTGRRLNLRFIARF